MGAGTRNWQSPTDDQGPDRARAIRQLPGEAVTPGFMGTLAQRAVAAAAVQGAPIGRKKKPLLERAPVTTAATLAANVSTARAAAGRARAGAVSTALGRPLRPGGKVY